MPPLVSDRELVQCISQRTDKQTGTTTILYRNAKHHSRPERKGVIRWVHKYHKLYNIHNYIQYWWIHTLYLCTYNHAGLRQFFQAQSFGQILKMQTPLECLFCFNLIWRGGSHISLWMPLQRELQASGEMLSSTSTKKFTLKNCKKRWKGMSFNFYQNVCWKERHPC